MLSRRSLLLAAAGAILPAASRAQEAEQTWQDRLIAAARRQVGVTTVYDAAYVRLAYPGGDVPRERGVCTDVVVRAYRDAFGLDLQKLVHEDMRRTFAAYPRTWGLRRPDPNIDHRRVPNLTVFFGRRGAALPISSLGSDYLPGDIVSIMLPGNLPHIAIVSSATATAEPANRQILHNIGQGAREEDGLFAYPHTGHFRLSPGKLST